MLFFVTSGYFGGKVFKKGRRHEETLRQTEETYRTIFETTGNASCIIQDNLVLKLVNAEFEVLSGYAKEEVERKKSLTDFVSIEDVERIEGYHHLRNVNPNLAPRNYELRFVDKYGSIKDVWMTIGLISGTGERIASLMDVSERKLMERKLRESESRFRAIYEGSPIGIGILDSEGQPLDCNAVMERIFGYSKEELRQMNFIDFTYPGDYVVDVTQCKGIDSTDHYTIDKRYIRKDGRVVWGRLNYSLLRTPDGEPWFSITMVEDITEQRRADIILKRRLEVKKAVSKVASVLVSEKDVKFDEILAVLGPAVKAGWACTLHFKAGEKRPYDIVEWYDAGVESRLNLLINVDTNELTWLTERLVSQNYVTITDISDIPEEAVYERKLYELCDVRSLLIIPLFRVSKIIGMMAFGTVQGKRFWHEDDIRQLLVVPEIIVVYTQRKQAEESLIRSEQRYRELVENQGEGVAITDNSSRVTFANPAAHDIFGTPPGELIGRSFNEFIVNKSKLSPLKNLLYKSRSKVTFEVEAAHVTGKRLTLNVTATPRFNKKGELSEIFAIFWDITDKKTAEGEIQYLNFHDKLTGLYNRAYFEEQLRLLDTGKHLPISIIMGDVNGLKLVNDAFGHQEGDKLLIRISQMLQTFSRKRDIVARWGGDEFAIVLPKTPERVAMGICERIKKVCQETDKTRIPPSIALGVATKEGLAQDIEEVLGEAEDRMYRNKLVGGKSARGSIISSLQKTLGERTHETEKHAWRLQNLSQKMGQALHLPDSELDELLLVAVMHDIGKVAIPDNILKNPGKLSPEDWEIMKKHPEIGYRIAKSSCELSHIAEAILYHHERWDGTGYPEGLKGANIPLISRIVSIVDSYDVMTNGRPYKAAISKQEALRELKRCAGTQFDPELVSVFCKVMSGMEGIRDEEAAEGC